LTLSGDATVQVNVDLSRYLAWTEGRLVYDETPLRDALTELGRWYDMDFVLADSTLGARHLTATLAGEAISETLTLLSSTLGVDYERHGRTVTFRSHRRAP
jgi:ferric-dicitrate binding protein FerR (iron transport regulator)